MIAFGIIAIIIMGICMLSGVIAVLMALVMFISHFFTEWIIDRLERSYNFVLCVFVVSVFPTLILIIVIESLSLTN